MFIDDDRIVSVGLDIATLGCFPLQEIHSRAGSMRQNVSTIYFFILDIHKSYAYSVSDKLCHIFAFELDHDAGLMVLHCL